MRYVSGSLLIRTGSLRKGEAVVGHKHTFGHTTFCRSGALRLELLVGDHESAIERSWDLSAANEINWQYIEQGRYHRLIGLEDGTRYQCVYSHQEPHAYAIGGGGNVDRIVQEPNGWEPSYA